MNITIKQLNANINRCFNRLNLTREQKIEHINITYAARKQTAHNARARAAMINSLYSAQETADLFEKLKAAMNK